MKFPERGKQCDDEEKPCVGFGDMGCCGRLSGFWLLP